MRHLLFFFASAACIFTCYISVGYLLRGAAVDLFIRTFGIDELSAMAMSFLLGCSMIGASVAIWIPLARRVYGNDR